MLIELKRSSKISLISPPGVWLNILQVGDNINNNEPSPLVARSLSACNHLDYCLKAVKGHGSRTIPVAMKRVGWRSPDRPYIVVMRSGRGVAGATGWRRRRGPRHEAGGVSTSCVHRVSGRR